MKPAAAKPQTPRAPAAEEPEEGEEAKEDEEAKKEEEEPEAGESEGQSANEATVEEEEEEEEEQHDQAPAKEDGKEEANANETERNEKKQTFRVSAKGAHFIRQLGLEVSLEGVVRCGRDLSKDVAMGKKWIQECEHFLFRTLGETDFYHVLDEAFRHPLLEKFVAEQRRRYEFEADEWTFGAMMKTCAISLNSSFFTRRMM